MEGDFEANVDFEESGGRQGASKEELLNFSKFFVGSNDTNPDWGRSNALEPDDFKDPNYVFKAGKTYNLYVVGRSSQLAIDRIYLVRLADQDGNLEGDGIYSYQSFRGNVNDGLYDESQYRSR